MGRDCVNPGGTKVHTGVAAVIILYYPQQKELESLIDSLRADVDALILMDNTPEGCGFSSLITPEKVFYVPLRENMGIAKAQNLGIEEAQKRGAEFVLLMDQDSCFEPGGVKALRIGYQELERAKIPVAAVGPLCRDPRTNSYIKAIRHNPLFMRKRNITPFGDSVEVDYLIASGSLVRLSIFASVGPMMERLFIDGVDIEWGQRAYSKGYRFFIIPKSIMSHVHGDKKIRLLLKDVVIHSEARNFFLIRNWSYLLTLPYVSFWWKITMSLKMPLYFLIYSLYSERPLKAFSSLMSAFCQGVRGHFATDGAAKKL